MCVPTCGSIERSLLTDWNATSFLRTYEGMIGRIWRGWHKAVTSSRGGARRMATIVIKVLAPVAVFAICLMAPAPSGLTAQGQASLAVMCLAVILWATESLHIVVTGIICVVLLLLVGGVGDIGTALYGFSQPVAYFLIGILTIGMAVHRSGLAERVAFSADARHAEQPCSAVCPDAAVLRRSDIRVTVREHPGRHTCAYL